MKALVVIFLCSSVSISAAQSLTDNATVSISPLSTFGQNTIKTYVLDDENVFVIRVPQPNKGVTTLSFPAAITALQGSNVSQVPHPEARFLIDYTPGSNFFSLLSTGRGETNLNVIYKGKIYVLDLVPSDKPDYAINFVHDTFHASNGHASAVLPTSVLVGLLDKAKALPLLAQSDPDVMSQVEVAAPLRVMYYSGFRVQIDKVYRFESEDTLVFALTLINDTAENIAYLPNNFAVRVGDRVFTQSLSEASGLIPAGRTVLDVNGKPQLGFDGKPTIQPTSTNAYFEITGDDKGNRNNLRADNAWNVLVSRINDNDERVLRPISNASLDDGPGAMAAPSGMANEVDPKRLAP
jgi:hypothetical protein